MSTYSILAWAGHKLYFNGLTTQQALLCIFLFSDALNLSELIVKMP